MGFLIETSILRFKSVYHVNWSWTSAKALTPLQLFTNIQYTLNGPEILRMKLQQLNFFSNGLCWQLSNIRFGAHYHEILSFVQNERA